MNAIETEFSIVETRHGAVSHIELVLRQPGYLDVNIVQALAQALERLDTDHEIRAIVLGTQGKVFCAGADLSGAANGGAADIRGFYQQVMRLYRTKKPIVAAVQGPAVGAGMGLALIADFRVAAQASRFCSNFNRLGIHPGFGMSVTLPHVVGMQKASMLFYTGRRITGAEALDMGLVDELVADELVLERAIALAQEIAASAPLAVESTRATLRMGLADRIDQVNQREVLVQFTQVTTADFREGVKAMAERRTPVFTRS